MSVTDTVLKGLSRFSPTVKIAKSGSVYVTLTGCKVREIRISDHAGHKLKSNVWELCSSRMTSRKNPKNRVYNVKDVSNLISDVVRACSV